MTVKAFLAMTFVLYDSIPLKSILVVIVVLFSITFPFVCGIEYHMFSSLSIVFASWTEHVKRVAAMAEENQAEVLCIGCEMVGTDHREREWRRLIDEAFVRGTGWWDWPATRLYPEFAGEDQNGYCTWGKPANRLLRQFSQRYGDRNDGNGKSFPAEE